MPIKVQVPDVSATHLSARDAVAHAIKFLAAQLAKPRFVVPKDESRLYLEMRRDLPYIIHDTAVPGTQLLVNRNYKPVGNNSGTGENWVNYELATNGHTKLTPAQIASVVSPPHKRGLFGDGNQPWADRREAMAYLGRLKLLYGLL